VAHEPYINRPATSSGSSSDIPDGAAQIVRVMALPSFVVDDAGYVRLWNRPAEQLLGHGEKEAVGASIDVLGLAAHGTCHDLLETLGDEQSLSCEAVLRKRNGEEVACELHVSRMLDRSSASTLWIVRDITDQKERDEFLHKRETVSNLILRIGQNINARSDLDGVLTEIVQAVEYLVDARSAVWLADEEKGLVPAGAPGEGVSTGQCRTFSSEDIERRAEILARGEARPEFTVSEGDRAAVTIPLEGRNGPVGLMNVEAAEGSRNFTTAEQEILFALAGQAALAIERSMLHDRITLSERNYRSIFETVREGIFVCDGSGRPLRANPALVKMLGFDTEGEFLDHCAGATAWPADEVAAVALQDNSGGDVRPCCETALRRKDGSQFQAEVVVSPHRDENGRVDRVDGFVRDVTERRRLEGSFRIYSRYLEKVGKELYRERRLFKTLADRIPQRIAVIAPEYRLEFIDGPGSGTGVADDRTFCYDQLWQRSDPCPWCPLDVVSRKKEGVSVRVEQDGKKFSLLVLPITNEEGTLDGFMEVVDQVGD